MARIPANLGESLSLSPANGDDDITFTGIYTAPYVEAFGGPNPGIAASVPRVMAVLSDIAAVRRGDMLTRGTQDFKVVAVEPDSLSDTVVLQLELQG